MLSEVCCTKWPCGNIQQEPEDSSARLCWGHCFRTRRTCDCRRNRDLADLCWDLSIRLANHPHIPRDNSGMATVSCLEPEWRPWFGGGGRHMLSVPSLPHPSGMAAMPTEPGPTRICDLGLQCFQAALSMECPALWVALHQPDHSRGLGEEVLPRRSAPGLNPLSPQSPQPLSFRTHCLLPLDTAAVSPSLSQNIPHSSHSL